MSKRVQGGKVNSNGHVDIQGANVELLPAGDVLETLAVIDRDITTTILDPWYNKGIGGTREDYDQWLNHVVMEAAELSQHVFVWGFPEIVCRVLDQLPRDYSLTAWLTWYYKNCPSVIRGWRSAQMTCLHISREGAKLYPEHFLNHAQLEKQRERKLRYVPGPSSVIEIPLNIGFVGKKEQTGHPAQKPMKVFEPLILMTTKEGDWVLDPMCGSGTTGEICMKLHRNAILSDNSERWLEVTKNRLSQNMKRSIPQQALLSHG